MGIPPDQLRQQLGPAARARNPDLAGPEALTPVSATVSQAVEREIEELHRPIMEDCDRMGWIYARSDPTRPTHRTPAGEPDFLIWGEYPLMLLVECKARGKKPSHDQLICHARFRKLGWTVHIVRSHAEFRAVVEQTIAAGEEARTHPTGRLALISQLYPKGM